MACDEIAKNNQSGTGSLHEDSLVIDGLIPNEVYLEDPEYKSTLTDAGITAANFTVAAKADFSQAVNRLQHFWSLIEQRSETIAIMDSDDLRTAQHENLTGVILGFQNAQPIQLNLDNVQTLHRLGTRVIQLTYNSQNYVGTGCWERHDAGLTHFGRSVVDELNECGIVIDLSHCGESTALEAADRSTDPVAFTHVGVRDLGNAEGRGKSAEEIKAVAETGGVIGITPYPPYLKQDPETNEVLDATIDDVVDHIGYVADLVGVEHVGFGSDLDDRKYDTGKSTVADFDEWHLRVRAENEAIFGSTPPDQYSPPEGLDRLHKLPNLSRRLLERGFTEREVKQIMGENFQRLFSEVWE